ncbi:hypothetical protein BDA96_10G287100 [Sorghum bicolor]|uniref:BTB domain-containing protein n=1 Tax=Sorghum bicolor TaxID=4558 RepID=A0A921Q7J5_SORBI|nr:hypothetical protein BDA96_10G287100 [Sorghum bicolor]
MQNYAACINLTNSARSVQLFKIDAFTATREKGQGSIASTRTSVGGYDWVINYHPRVVYSNQYWIMFRITLDSDGTGVVASFACRLVDVVDQTGGGQHLGSSSSPVPAAITSATLSKGQANDVYITTRSKLASSGYLKDDSFLVECVITVLLENRSPTQDAAAAAANLAPTTTSAAAAPPSDLGRHFGELWRNQKGTDVTFLVSGEPIAAHKCVLAARSPYFMAELFGDMKEKASQHVEIEDMRPEVFRALMQFIYTDTSPPELQVEGKEEEEEEEEEEDARMMAQHLLVAADRYGMERLKIICEEKMCADISVDTVSTALALAEQHGCSELKARCIKFIVATPANLRAVVKTEGYAHLIASCPSVVHDLLLAIMADRHK